MALTLRTAITAGQTTFDVLGADDLQPGDFKNIDTETFVIRTAKVQTLAYGETPRYRVSVYRAAGGTRAAAHDAAATLATYTGGGASGLPDPIGAPDGQVVQTVGEAYELDTLPKDFYASDTDPGAVGAGSVWKDTSELPSETWWRRNTTNDGWDADFAPRVFAVGDAYAGTGMYASTSGAGAAFAGLGADATGEGGASIAGSVSTAGAGTASGGRTVAANGDGGADATDLVSTTSALATAGFSVTSTTGTLSLLFHNDGGDGDGLRALTLTGLPTTDPAVADELWNNVGFVAFSGAAVLPVADVSELSMTVSDPPTQVEVQIIADQVNALRLALIAMGFMDDAS